MAQKQQHSNTHSKRRGLRRSRLCLLGAPPGGSSSGLRGCLAAPRACSFLSSPSTLTLTTPMTAKPEHSRASSSGKLLHMHSAMPDLY